MAEWIKHYTDDGIDYYYNEDTKETVWNPPADYASSSEAEDGEEESDDEAGETGSSGGAEEAQEDDEWRNEAEYHNGLLGELQEWGLFDKPEIHGSDVDQEKVNLVKTRIEEGAGTDQEWMECFQANNFAIVEYLLLLGQAEGAITTLAHAGNLYPQLWADFIISERRLTEVLKATVVAVERVRRCFLAEKEVLITYKHYVGYDKRDSVTYGAAVEESDEDEENVQIEDKNLEERQNVIVHLFMVFNFFVCEVPFLKARVAHGYASSRTSLAQLGVTDKDLADLAGAKNATEGEVLKAIAQYLVMHNKFFSEDVYLLSIKVLAGLNRQFVSGDDSSTELASLLVAQQANLDEERCVGLSEGIMHTLNEVLYPAHFSLEALPVVRLCKDLVQAAGTGFFYRNDADVIADIILRELHNLPTQGDDERVILALDELRVHYIHFAGAVLAAHVAEEEKEEALTEILKYIRAEGSEWCSDIAGIYIDG